MAAINDETVEALLEEVKDLLDDEDRRSQSFIARGSGLAGFVGLIVALVGLVGQPGVHLPTPAKLALAVLFVLGIVFLVGAVAFVLAGVLLPSPGKAVSTWEVKRYPTHPFISEEKVMAQGRRLRGLVNALAIERDRNERKGRWLTSGYVLLGAGILCISGDALILGLHEIL
jgi:hypothetical protein